MVFRLYTAYFLFWVSQHVFNIESCRSIFQWWTWQQKPKQDFSAMMWLSILIILDSCPRCISCRLTLMTSSSSENFSLVCFQWQKCFLSIFNNLSVFTLVRSQSPPHSHYESAVISTSMFPLVVQRDFHRKTPAFTYDREEFRIVTVGLRFYRLWNCSYGNHIHNMLFPSSKSAIAEIEKYIRYNLLGCRFISVIGLHGVWNNPLKPGGTDILLHLQGCNSISNNTSLWLS